MNRLFVQASIVGLSILLMTGCGDDSNPEELSQFSSPDPTASQDETKPIPQSPLEKEACKKARKLINYYMLRRPVPLSESVKGKYQYRHIGFDVGEREGNEAGLTEIRYSELEATEQTLTDADRLNGLIWKGTVTVKGSRRNWPSSWNYGIHRPLFEQSWRGWYSFQGSLSMQKYNDGWRGDPDDTEELFNPRRMRPVTQDELTEIDNGQLPPSITKPIMSITLPLLVNSKTVAGEIINKRDNSKKWPFKITFEHYSKDEKRFSGKMEWTSLGGIAYIEGGYKGDELFFTVKKMLKKHLIEDETFSYSFNVYITYYINIVNNKVFSNMPYEYTENDKVVSGWSKVGEIWFSTRKVKEKVTF